MKWLIFALGVALAVGGAASIVSGLPYIRMESGWTEVIAGTTALSAGVMTVALAAILGALRRLEPRYAQNIASVSEDGARRSLGTEPIFSPEPASVPVSEGADATSLEAGSPVPSVAERDGPPLPAGRSLEERIWSGPSSSGTAGNERTAPVPLETYRPTDRSSGARPAAPVLSRDRDLRRRPESGDFGAAVPRTFARSGLASPVRSDADDRVPSLLPSSRPPAVEAEPASGLVESPTVVGRYESGGASYVLFSDGTIEVETEMGTHRFASMEDLKAYIDQQDKASLG